MHTPRYFGYKRTPQLSSGVCAAGYIPAARMGGLRLFPAVSSRTDLGAEVGFGHRTLAE